MQRQHRRFHLLVCGGSGTGKTTYAVKFLAHAQAECRFVFDPDGEFSELLELAPARTTYELDQAILTGWVVYDPHTMFPGRLETALDFFASYAHKASGMLPGRKFFAVDELGMYVNGSAVPMPLRVVLQTGRRVGLDGVFMAQQPNELHNFVRAQLTEVCCFQLTDDRALEFPAKFGFDPEAVRRLAPFHYICRNNRGGQVSN